MKNGIALHLLHNQVLENDRNSLSHHGIMGMRWGKKNGPPYPLDRKVSAKIKRGDNPAVRKRAKMGSAAPFIIGAGLVGAANLVRKKLKNKKERMEEKREVERVQRNAAKSTAENVLRELNENGNAGFSIETDEYGTNISKQTRTSDGKQMEIWETFSDNESNLSNREKVMPSTLKKIDRYKDQIRKKAIDVLVDNAYEHYKKFGINEGMTKAEIRNEFNKAYVRDGEIGFDAIPSYGYHYPYISYKIDSNGNVDVYNPGFDG